MRGQRLYMTCGITACKMYVFSLHNKVYMYMHVHAVYAHVHVHVGTGTYRLYMYMYIGIVHVLYVHSLQNHYILSLHVQVYQYTMCIMIVHVQCTCS